MTTPKVQAFLDELNALQKRHGLHLEHDDGFAVYDGEDTIRASDETHDARVAECTRRFRDAWVHRHGQTRNVRYWFAVLCSALGRTTAAQRRRDRIARARLEECRLAHERAEQLGRTLVKQGLERQRAAQLASVSLFALFPYRTGPGFKPCTHEYEPPLYHGACRKCGERRA